MPSTGAPSKKSVARIGQTGTQSVFSQRGKSRKVTPILAKTQSSGAPTRATPQVLSPTMASPPNAPPRRNSRLLTSDSSTTEENRRKLKGKFPPKISNRKTKSKANKGGITPPNVSDSHGSDKIGLFHHSRRENSRNRASDSGFNLQKAAAAEGLMSLPRERGKGYLALCSHHGKEAVSQYLEPSSFSPPQYRLGTVPNWKGLF